MATGSADRCAGAFRKTSPNNKQRKSVSAYWRTIDRELDKQEIDCIVEYQYMAPCNMALELTA